MLSSSIDRSKFSIVIPTFNEADHIGQILSRLLKDAPSELVEIIVVDGRSTDATRQIVEASVAADARVRLVDNPRRLQSAGVNIAVHAADPASEVILRMDAHAGYPDDFVERCMTAFAQSRAESVVVALRTVGTNCFGRAVAAVSNSRYGSGGSIHRVGGRSGFVDHGHHAVFSRAAYERVGGYDETFSTNEDAEFDIRLRASGGSIWFTDSTWIDYFPRKTPAALARQYFRYGRGRASTVLKHKIGLRLRQALPLVLLAGIIFSALAAVISPFALLVPLAYLALVSLVALQLTIQTRSVCMVGAAAALPIMHLSWALGFVARLISAGVRPARGGPTPQIIEALR